MKLLPTSPDGDLRAQGAQAVDAARDAILAGYTPEQVVAFINSEAFKSNVIARNLYEDLLEANASPEAIAFSLILVEESVDVFFDKDSGQLKVKLADCADANFSQPCDVPLSELRDLAQYDAESFANKVQSIVLNASTRVVSAREGLNNGELTPTEISILNAEILNQEVRLASCAIAWSMLTGDETYINQAKSVLFSASHSSKWVSFFEDVTGDFVPGQPANYNEVVFLVSHGNSIWGHDLANANSTKFLMPIRDVAEKAEMILGTTALLKGTGKWLWKQSGDGDWFLELVKDFSTPQNRGKEKCGNCR